MSRAKIVAAAGKLKTVKRQGWLDAGIPWQEVESVADHSYRTALMVALTARPGLDMTKALKMALVHDIGEASIGDLTPKSGVPRRKKASMEEAAVRRLGDDQLLLFFREYQDGKTPEARLVSEMDVLERVAQAREYEIRFPGKDLSRFQNDPKGPGQPPRAGTPAGGRKTKSTQ